MTTAQSAAMQAEDDIWDDSWASELTEVQSEQPQVHEWDKYFDADENLEQLEIASDEPIEFEPVQQDVIKSPLMRGGTVLMACVGLCAFAAWGISIMFSGQTPQEQVVARTVPTVDPNTKLVGTLKGQAIFDRQANEDEKFKKSGKVGQINVKAKKVPPPPTQSNGPDPRYVTPIRSLPVSAEPAYSSPPPSYSPPPVYSPPPAYSPQPVQSQSRPRVDPNQLWAQIAQGSTMNFEGVDSGTQEVAVMEYNASLAQNVANWETVQGEYAAPVPTLGKTIPMQTEVTATLQIPVSASGSQQAVLALDSPLKANGAVILPAKTLLVASVQPDGGLMNLRINAAYVNGQQLSIPGDSIMVLAANKQFLIAQSFNRKSGLGRGVRDFALGMVGGIAEQALSPSSSTTIGNGFSSTTVNNASRSLTNSLLGGAKGGVNTLIQNIQAQNNNSEPESPVSGLKAGTRVRLIFTAPTNI